MKLKLLTITGLLLLGGCASPWVAYEGAVRCHLDDKGPECNPKYQKAIAQGPKLPGIHSSYGTHLLLQGKTDEAAHEFQLEQQNYPTESARVIAALTNPNAVAAANAQPPVADTTATAAKSVTAASDSAAVAASATPVATKKSATPAKSSKAASAKKDATHAK